MIKQILKRNTNILEVILKHDVLGRQVSKNSIKIADFSFQRFVISQQDKLCSKFLKGYKNSI